MTAIPNFADVPLTAVGRISNPSASEGRIANPSYDEALTWQTPERISVRPPGSASDSPLQNRMQGSGRVTQRESSWWR